MDHERFEEAYGRLNAAQREAVDTIEGPVMVVAGPGTGKTQILTLRIANILKKTDTAPENILALTFTESGARAMRERLASYIGAPAYRVHVHTFHEFAGRCIREFPDAYEKRVGGRPVTDLEKVTMLETILETPSLTLLRPSGNPGFYIGPIVSALSLMKREYITPETFREIIAADEAVLAATPKVHEKGAHKGKVRSEYIEREKRLGRSRELLFVYETYEALLGERGFFDYDDMIFETVRALEGNEDMLRALQETYQYVLADEHQDVNGSQNRILELLASFHERPNLFVVGDEKQSIYRFQGASLENFLYFGETYPHTKTIALTENYRSAQDILDLAHELISVDAGAAKDLRVPLTAAGKATGSIERRNFSHEAVEHDAIVAKIGELILRDVPREEIAVIVRTNGEVEELSRYLRAHGIPAEASADGDILAHPITRSVRMLLGAAIDPANESCLFEVLQSGFSDVPSGDLALAMRRVSWSRPLRHVIEDEATLRECGVVNPAPFVRLAGVLRDARERMGIEAPHRILERLIRESGLLDHAVTIDPYEGSRVIRRLYDEVEEMVRRGEAETLAAIERMFKTRVAHNLPLSAPYVRANRRSVEVMTAHKAKGLEFRHVFVPHLTDSKWGGRARADLFRIPVARRLKDDVGPEDDERKLLYVAMTRAKEGLYLSSSGTSTEGRSLLPTRLLEDLGEDLITEVDTAKEEETFDPARALSATLARVPFDPALLIETLRERGLSVTALNNYLRSPWNYFYRNVLRIPEVEAESLLFGTALHDSLESAMKHRREKGALPSTSELSAYLEREFSKLPLTNEEYVRNHERGLTALSKYLAHVGPALPVETKEEYKIDAVIETGVPELPTLRLTGMLDRLDFDETGKLVRVVDYKTGKPKTRGYIEGTTKDSTGDYKRQLVFYALLLSLSGDERLQCRDGVLSFIEADEKGRIHEEAYTVTDEEMADLKTLIQRVVADIAKGAFLDAPCDPAVCDYCELVAEQRRRTAA